MLGQGMIILRTLMQIAFRTMARMSVIGKKQPALPHNGTKVAVWYDSIYDLCRTFSHLICDHISRDLHWVGEGLVVTECAFLRRFTNFTLG